MLNDAAIARFRADLQGRVLQPSDAGYDEARTVFNGMIDKRPALIVRCAVVSDVISAVKLARETDALVSVRAGGHGVAGNALCEDGVVIDLSAMKRVWVDPGNRTARAEGGTTWGDFDNETQAFGLATTGGIVPSTGVAGLTLGGGFGYLCRKHSLACDNLLSAEVVTADGQRLTARTGENADLFWALRGGGGNFGVVTSMEYQTHPVGPVLAGEVIYPIDQAKAVLRFYRDWSASAPDEVRADATLLAGPHGPALDVILCYCGSLEQGEKVLRPMRSCGSPVADTVAPVPYSTVQNLLTQIIRPGQLHYWKSGFVHALSDEAVEALVDFFTSNPPGFLTVVAIEHLGGAVTRVAPQNTAFAHRDAQHSLLVARMWQNPAESEKNIDWVRRCYQTAEPFLKPGVYVNYLGDEGEARVKAAYGVNYEQLRAVKTKYDPTNFFRLNQNITPGSRKLAEV